MPLTGAWARASDASRHSPCRRHRARDDDVDHHLQAPSNTMPVLAAPEAAGSERNSPVVPTSASVSPPEQYLASKEWN